MGLIIKKKCRHCSELFIPDARNAKRQTYCRKPDCRKASKHASQKRWMNKPENRDYFRGQEHVKRVQAWRMVNPGYWRRTATKRQDALQDPLIVKPNEITQQNSQFVSNALQDLLMAQPTVLIGLIANFTGDALQDNIANTLRRLQELGQDIVSGQTPTKGGRDGNQDATEFESYPKSPRPVQLGRSSPGPKPTH